MSEIHNAYGRPWSRENVLECVGPGWYTLVNRLIDDLFGLGWDGELHQIKEKFGGLRFYIGAASDEVFDRILDAENESYKTCEQCGQPGKLRGDGWMYTACDEHTRGKR